MPYAELLFVSAKTGQRLNKIYDMIDMVIESQTMRIPTGVLNEILTEAVAMQQPPSDKGKRLRIYYSDTDCRMTAFLLLDGLLHAESTEADYNGTYLMFDTEAIDNADRYKIIKQKINMFTTENKLSITQRNLNTVDIQIEEIPSSAPYTLKTIG